MNHQFLQSSNLPVPPRTSHTTSASRASAPRVTWDESVRKLLEARPDVYEVGDEDELHLICQSLQRGVGGERKQPDDVAYT